MIIKLLIKYLTKRGYLVLLKDSKSKTVFFDCDGNKWTAWRR